MRSRIIAALGLLALSLAACDLIVGLDKFQKCDACPEDASGDTGSVDASDSGDAADLPDGVSEASSWPRWRMPNALTEVAEGGASDASLASFTVSNGEIVDNVSQIKWNAQLGKATSFDEAAGYCAQLKARLPTRIEAATLLDSTRPQLPFTHPELDVIFVPDGSTPPPALWTASYSRPIKSPLHFWFASLETGDMVATLPVQGLGVLCVK